MIARQPEAMQLRYLQTLSDIATGTTNAKLVLPIPLDFFRMFLQQTERGKSAE